MNTHAHESRVHFLLDEIRDDLQTLGKEIIATAFALDRHEDPVLASARIANFAVMERRQEISRLVAVLREMLGVR